MAETSDFIVRNTGSGIGHRDGCVCPISGKFDFSRHFPVRAEFRGLVFAAPTFMNETFRSNTMHQYVRTNVRSCVSVLALPDTWFRS
jgi:hypothetical protein